MEPLKIKQKIEDMIAYAYIVLAQFPKSEKHTLAAEIKKSMFRLLELVIACNKKYFKKTTMQELDIELDILRSYVRLAVTLKFVPLKKIRSMGWLLDRNWENDRRVDEVYKGLNCFCVRPAGAGSGTMGRMPGRA